MTSEPDCCSSCILHPQQHLFSEQLAHRVALSSLSSTSLPSQTTGVVAMSTPSTVSLPFGSLPPTAGSAAPLASLSAPSHPPPQVHHSQASPVFSYHNTLLGCLCVASAATACYYIYRYRVRAAAQPLPCDSLPPLCSAAVMADGRRLCFLLCVCRTIPASGPYCSRCFAPCTYLRSHHLMQLHLSLRHPRTPLSPLRPRPRLPLHWPPLPLLLLPRLC